jgi:hypothetical protein
MSNLTFHNAADEVLVALTHGPTAGLQDWEIRESSAGGCKTSPNATAILTINGHDYRVEITALPDGE